jgi:hypothetical protein
MIKSLIRLSLGIWLDTDDLRVGVLTEVREP